MKRHRAALFFVIVLAVSAALIVFIAPRASSLPDGLEWVATNMGFDKSENESAVSKSAPMKGYAVNGVNNNALSKSISGVAGMAAVFLTAWAVASAVKRRDSENTAEKPGR